MGHEINSPLRLSAKWTDDCQGKKDYDGEILSVSTRYWPSGGGFHILDEHGFRQNEDGSQPSANSSLLIWHGEKEMGDYIELVSKDFKADTFELVAAQVEEWAQQQMDIAVSALRAAFNGTQHAD